MFTLSIKYRNPYSGELFNHPNGSDVYQGVQVDYKGEVSKVVRN